MKAAKTPRAKARLTPAPEGLRLAFNWLRPSDGTSRFGRITADETHGHARRVISELQADGHQGTVLKILDRATDEIFEWDTPPHGELQLTQEAAFHVGFATCWLMMMAINGKADAR